MYTWLKKQKGRLFERKFKSAGFTLIESAVAILIISIGITPGLYVATSSLDVSETLKNNLIGAFLAQEGIEVIRYLRDRNWLLCDEFETGLVGSWAVDVNSDWVNCDPSRTLTPIGSNPPIRLDPTTGLYSYGTGGQTPFQRVVTVTQPTPEKLLVVSEVFWRTKGGATGPGCPNGTRCIRVESYLYNWR